jgi:phospholipid/cholesterol/gamma-HCH transport system ATP-binding protein
VHPGAKRRGQVGVAADIDGISEGGQRDGDGGGAGHRGLSEREMQEVRRKVTMVFQNGALFDSITVGENVAFPLRERGNMEEDQILQVVKGLLEMVGVAGMENMLPSDLSTGMKRSVAIARALAAQPAAVLYDEPTTMVDPLMAHLLGDLIQRLKMQLHLTSIVVTHDMRFAQKLADRVVFLHEGKALFFGTMEEMRRSEDPVLRSSLNWTNWFSLSENKEGFLFLQAAVYPYRGRYSVRF